MLAGTPGAFETLIRAHERLCWHVISRMVRHPDDTRELCQDTFLRVHRYLHQYRFECALKSWIGQVAYRSRAAISRKRIPIAEPAADDSPSLVEQVADAFDLEAASADAELVAVLHAEIEALPPLQRTVLTLYHLDEVPIPEIAKITGLSAGTIKSHLFRCRARLRARAAGGYGSREMSTRRDTDTEREQREWDLQERALRAEASGAHDDGDPAVAEYRLVARALRTPPLDAAPGNFAAQTAARAERAARIANERVEVWIERGLMLLLPLAGAVALLEYEDVVVRWLSFSVSERAAAGFETVASWGLAIALCVGLSSAFAFARQR